MKLNRNWKFIEVQYAQRKTNSTHTNGWPLRVLLMSPIVHCFLCHTTNYHVPALPLLSSLVINISIWRCTVITKMMDVEHSARPVKHPGLVITSYGLDTMVTTPHIEGLTCHLHLDAGSPGHIFFSEYIASTSKPYQHYPTIRPVSTQCIIGTHVHGLYHCSKYTCAFHTE